MQSLGSGWVWKAAWVSGALVFACGAIVLGTVVLGTVLGGGAVSDAEEPESYRFLLPTRDAMPGESLRLTIQGDYARSIQGFSLAVRYPSDALEIRRVHGTDTIVDALEADYFEAKISPEDGSVVIGVLVDSKPPFTGALIPSLGFPLDLVHVDVTISGEARGDLTVSFEDGLSAPPIDNLFVVDNEAVAPTELRDGLLRLPGGGGEGGTFLRGDANTDLDVDVADPIAILSHIFLGTFELRCPAAADANDDESIDLSDSIFLLQYLFTVGSVPPPPHGLPGEDPTPGPLDCPVR